MDHPRWTLPFWGRSVSLPWLLIGIAVLAAIVQLGTRGTVRPDSASAPQGPGPVVITDPAPAPDAPDAPAAPAPRPEPTTSTCTVVTVIDGDTLDCSSPAGVQRVRLVGVDTPEIAHGGGRDQCHARDARTALGSLVLGRRVTLTGDARQGAVDRYGRRLAYVATDTNRDVGRTLLLEGHARLFGGRFDRMTRYADVVQGAQQRRVGLWGVCS